jgi:hypothetical protein
MKREIEDVCEDQLGVDDVHNRIRVARRDDDDRSRDGADTARDLQRTAL